MYSSEGFGKVGSDLALFRRVEGGAGRASTLVHITHFSACGVHVSV